MSSQSKRLLPWLCAAIGLASAGQASAAKTPPDLAGEWVITATMAEGSVSTGLELKHDGQAYAGHSGALDILTFRQLDYSGQMVGDRLHLEGRSTAGPVGSLDLKPEGETLVGQGVLYGTPVSVSARRPVSAVGHTPQVIDFQPKGFHPLTSSIPAPALRIFPGDTVRTTTVDTFGTDATGAVVSMPGNPGTGPFYVEGALPGDTVAIQIVSLKTNKSTARMNALLDKRALVQGYVQTPGAITDTTWLLDPAKGTASLRSPSDKLKGFHPALRPMLGVIAVAFPGGFSVPNRDLGEWGGNMDFPELREGVTLYLPVYQAGAMIFMGDGHALQGHGEVTGQGLETSLAVEFKVGLIKHQAMAQPWSENADYIMVSGIGGSLDDSMERATSGLAAWLKQKYRLDDSEVAAVLGAALEYQIAEVVDPKPHVVAKIRKDVLSQLPLPAQ